MKKRTEGFAPVVGGGSLLTALAVLCLTALTVLSLATVRAEQRLAEASAAAAEGYYAADCRAEEVFARLRHGESVPGVEREGNIVRYRCTVSAAQDLEVALEQTPEGWKVLRWKLTVPERELEQHLPVWKGKEEAP